MNFYKHYLGDYIRDTGHLTLIEHGAYRVLLDHYYATEKPLPADVPTLYRICKAFSLAERRAVDMVAKHFFPAGEDGLRHNQRADEEIQKHDGQAQHNRIVGKLGGRPKKKPEKNPDGNPDGNPEETQVVTRMEPGVEPGRNPNHSQKPEKATTPPASAGGPPDGAPDCPHESIIALYHEILPICPRVAEWTDARQTLLRTRWREKAKPNGKSQGYASTEAGLAYWRRYFAWVAQSKFLTGRADPKPGRPPFLASLEWLLKPSNFVKVIEGDFHR